MIPLRNQEKSIRKGLIHRSGKKKFEISMEVGSVH